MRAATFLSAFPLLAVAAAVALPAAPSGFHVHVRRDHTHFGTIETVPGGANGTPREQHPALQPRKGGHGGGHGGHHGGHPKGEPGSGAGRGHPHDPAPGREGPKESHPESPEEGLQQVLNQAVAMTPGTQANDNDIKSAFVNAVLDKASAKFPKKNVVVYHDSRCKYHFSSGTHQHYEVNVSTGTFGYDVWVFDSGTFELVGDGGFINWGYQGKWSRDGNKITFSQM